jgi:hypothetical protein
VARKQTTAARYAQFTGLGLLLPASTFVGYAIGYYLDKIFRHDLAEDCVSHLGERGRIRDVDPANHAGIQ